MDKTIRIDEAEDIMRDLLKDKPEKIEHSLKVSDFAYRTALEIKKIHPELEINLDKLRIICLLHDIGQLNEDHIMHSFESRKLLERMGLEMYADSVVRHGDTHELAAHLGMGMDLRPRTIEEKIMVYADSHFKNAECVGPDEKFKRVRKVVKEKYPDIMELTESALKRIGEIIAEIDSLKTIGGDSA